MLYDVEQWSPAVGSASHRDPSGARAMLFASLVPTITACLLLWAAIATAMSNPIEGLATFCFWFVSALSSLAAGCVSIAALAMLSDTTENQTRVTRLRAWAGASLVLNLLIVIGPILLTVIAARS